MKTEFDYGRDYAEFMNGYMPETCNSSVDIDEMVSGTVSIPDDDHSEMVRNGIDNPNAREYWRGYNSFFISQAAATLGRMTSKRKKKTSAENGRKSKNGGRPKRGAYSLELVYDSGAMVNVDSGFDTLAEAVEALNKRPPVPNGTTLITRGDGVFYDCDGKRVYR